MIQSVPQGIVQQIESSLRSKVTGFSFASGGCINHGGKLRTSHGAFFLKWNDAGKYPGMFVGEAKGLALLRQSSSLAVPEVILHGVAEPHQFLMLGYIESSARSKGYWKDFGSRLAALHKSTAVAFGLDHDNYIGSLPQLNRPSASWTEFFIERRLSVQLKMAYDANKLDPVFSTRFHALFEKLSSLIPEERPALLHGDLWGGNLMSTEKGEPCVIDPAVYFGNREVDLAMTRLFGGFDFSFLQSYQESYPLIPGFEERFDLYNLYPLLVHVNLFGGGYAAQVGSVLKQFV